jgi:hypothetical protein
VICGSHPNSRTVVRQSSRTNHSRILRDGHEVPAHTICEQFGMAQASYALLVGLTLGGPPD